MINSSNYEINITNITYEVDAIGKIREKLKVKEGKLSFKEGINSLIKYVHLKQEKNPGAENYVNNVFKCPIIYKNFNDEEIPENKTFITEIKSGFDITSVKKQLTDRIFVIKNCLFDEDERPTYFIGIINLDSKNVNKLNEFLKINEEFNFNENTLIISVVDFNYIGIDTSYSINNDYILYKKLEETRTEMNSKFNELDRKINKLDEKLILNLIA